MKKFYITTPIYYVNGLPHIGHTYTSLAADVIARFKRLDGFEVHFLTGTDEHGQKIQKSAANAKIDTQAFVDNFAINFKNLAESLKISNDDFIRTTEERHKSYISNIWRKLSNNGYIYSGKYSGWYAVRDEAFYQASELVNDKAPTGAEVEWVEEESYFFKLSAFEDRLLDFYEKNPDFIMPISRKNEVISFVKSGLKDLSISRTTFNWGIKVPGSQNHVIYVWLDALFNYVSAINSDDLKEFWPCDLHIIGKDILRFHAVYWPAFLMAAGMDLPKKIFAHGWWTNEGVKISKSLGNVIDPLKLIEKFGLDYVRYFLMRAVPFGNDGNYVEHQFIGLINSELANNIGNLVQRVLSFIMKNCDGVVPQCDALNAADEELLNASKHAANKMRSHIEKQEIDEAIGALILLSNAANSYIDFNAPWQLKKNDVIRMHTVLYVLVQTIKDIGILLQPFMPDAAALLLNAFVCVDRSLKSIGTSIEVGTLIRWESQLFSRI